MRPIHRGLAGVIELPRRLAKEIVEQAGFRPDAIVSDGDVPSLLAARALGIPAVALGHDLVFSRCRLPEGLPRLRVLACRRTTWASSRARRAVAVHFLPIEPETPGTLVARPERRLAPRAPASPGLSSATSASATRAACSSSSRATAGASSRSATRASTCPASRRALRSGRVPRSPRGRVGGRDHRRQQRPRRVRARRQCSVLALYDDRHNEQTLNALLAERAGVAVASSLAALSPAVVARFFDRCRAADFARIDLERALPSAPSAVLALLDEACAGGLVTRCIATFAPRVMAEVNTSGIRFANYAHRRQADRPTRNGCCAEQQAALAAAARHGCRRRDTNALPPVTLRASVGHRPRFAPLLQEQRR